MSTLEVNSIAPLSSSSDVTLGGSSKNIKFASGTTVDFSTNTPTLTLGADMKNTPAFAVKQVAGQSISNAVGVKATFDTTEFDTDSAFNTSSSRFVAPSGAGGKYYFQGFGNIGGIDAGEIGQIYFQKNGTTIGNSIVRNYLQGTNQLFRMVSTFTIELSATDYVEMYLYQNSGESQTVTNTFFTGFKLIGA